MTYNKIHVSFGALRKITGPFISYQYDVQQILVINGLNLPEYYEVDFCNEGDTYTETIVGTVDGGVAIPNKFLRTGKKVKAYLVLVGDGDVQTRYEITLPVNVRPQRQDIDPTDDQQLQIDALVAALNSGVAKAEEAVEHYPKITDGYWYVWDGDAGEYVSTDIKAEGTDGTDGVSPTVTIVDITGGHRVTITDEDHPTGQSFDVLDGTDGDDGYSPAVTITTITGGHRVTITDKTHPTGQSFDVMDGAPDAGSVSYDPSGTYQGGTVGAELQHQSRQISDVEENQIPELKSVLTKEDKLNTHQIGIVDYYSLNYQKFSEWTSNNSTLSIQDDGSLKGTVNSGKTRIILSFAPNWGLPKTTTIAIRLRAKFSKSVQATLSLRKTNALWAWSTAVSFGANVEKEVIYIVTTAQEIINSFALSTEADSLTADDYCIVSKCDIVNLDASPWNTSAEFRAACWNSDNRINDPYEILRMDNIPNSTFTYQKVGEVITITNELKCLGFQGNIRTDVITDDGTDVTEVRTLATPRCSMTIVTNKTTKNGSVTTNGI